jgi:hypothetical protein
VLNSIQFFFHYKFKNFLYPQVACRILTCGKRVHTFSVFSAVIPGAVTYVLWSGTPFVRSFVSLVTWKCEGFMGKAYVAETYVKLLFYRQIPHVVLQSCGN